MTARIEPLAPPYAPQTQADFDRIMPAGIAPLALFRTLARDSRLFERLQKGSLLDQGNLTLRQREIVIDRTTALCGSEYEWGVHVALFAGKAGFDEAMILSLARGSSADPCWSCDDKLLLDICDELNERADLDDETWARAKLAFSAESLMEILMLAGAYRTISYLTNALRLAPEDFAARFPGD